MIQVRFRLSFSTSLSALGAWTLLAGCGSADSREFIHDIGVGVSNEAVQMAVELSPQIPLKLSGDFDLGCYGILSVVPALEDNGTRMFLDLDLSAFAGSSLPMRERTSHLPNGTPLPPFLSTELGTWRLEPQSSWGGILHVGGDASRSIAGFSLELPFVDRAFPERISVSQEIFGRDGKPIGVASFYGPKLDGTRLVTSGGIFVAVDLEAAAQSSDDLSTRAWHRVRTPASDSGPVCTQGWHRTNGALAYGWHRTNGAVEAFGWHRTNGALSTYGWHRTNGSLEAMGWHRTNGAVEEWGWHRVNSVALNPAGDVAVSGPDAWHYKSLRALLRLWNLFQEKARGAGLIE